MKVLGLDLSYTRTGVCVWDGVQALTSNIKTTTKQPYIRRAQEIRRGIWQSIQEHSPEVISVEAPLVHAPRTELLTGLFFLVLDRLLFYGKPVISLSNPKMRMMMGVSQTRGAVKNKTEFKKRIVAKAQSLLGEGAPALVHDEADAFFLAYYTRRFWLDWKHPGSSVGLSDVERDVWYSEEPTKKIPKNPRKTRKRKPPTPKKKGVIHRHGEFLFLPTEGET